MTERLPYEEQLLQQLDALPLPDVNNAWADMERRLDEDEDKRIVPFWRRGCVAWILLAVVLLGIGWWVWQLQRNAEERTIVPTGEVEQKKKGIKEDRGDSIGTMITADSAIGKNSNSEPGTAKTVLTAKQGDNDVLKEKIITATITKKKPVRSPATNKEPVMEIKISLGKIKEQRDDRVNRVTKDSTANRPGTGSDTIALSQKRDQQDTLSRKKTDTLARLDPPDLMLPQDSSKKKTPEKVLNFFSAGLALHQQLPVDGQQLTPYNSLGRKGTLADYIPSVYFRFNHGDRWFLQTGFRYGAPQYNKEVTYDLKRNTAINTDTLKILKKTYYHQVPLTFNYKLLPGLTIGAGLVWNRFSSAVVHETILKPSIFPGQDTLLSAGVVKVKARDSAFSKSYLQALTELQYKWRRFSLGAAYSFGLQPYIRFRLPGGEQKNERNSSLQVFLRYELWRSKEK